MRGSDVKKTILPEDWEKWFIESVIDYLTSRGYEVVKREKDTN